MRLTNLTKEIFTAAALRCPLPGAVNDPSTQVYITFNPASVDHYLPTTLHLISSFRKTTCRRSLLSLLLEPLALRVVVLPATFSRTGRTLSVLLLATPTARRPRVRSTSVAQHHYDLIHANCVCATELKSLGAEVVKADIGDVESLKKAFKGAYGVFGVTGMSYSAAVPISG